MTTDRSGQSFRLSRARATLLLPAVLVAVSSCSDLLFVAPASPAAAGLGVSFSMAAGESAVGGTADAYDKANGIRIRVIRSAATVKDTTVALRPGQEEARIRLGIEPQSDEETVQLAVELLADGAPIFRGSAGIQLRAGVTVEAPVSLVPVPAAIELSVPSVTLPSIGETLRIFGAVTFATGDTITGAPVQWASSNTSIASVSADGTLVAHSNGSATVTATHGELSRDLAVSVNQVPAAIVFVPDTTSVRIGATIALEPIVRDGRGNPMAGQVVGAWATSNAVVASVDGQGRVTGLTSGTSQITASIGTVNGSITVRVRAPLPNVTTGPPTAVDSTRATLNATIDPRGVAGGEAWFEWGTTAELGQSTPLTPIGSAFQQSFSATLTGLSTQATYHYRVAARTVAGTARGEIVAFQTTIRDTVPAVPVLTADEADGSVFLEWETAGGLPATQFRVERRVGSAGLWMQIGTVAGNLPREFRDSPGGGPFDYRVRGCNALGCSGYSNLETVILDSTVPFATTREPSAVTHSSAMLNGYLRPNGAVTTWWFEIAAQAEFAQPQICPGGESGLGIHADWVVACNVTDLLAGSFLYVRLVAQNSVGRIESTPVILELLYEFD